MSAIQSLKKILENENVPFEKQEFKREAFLGRPNNGVNDDVYFVLSGSLRVYFLDEYEEHILYFGYKNSLITDMDSFFSKKSSSLYIQTIKKTTVLKISKEELMLYMTSNLEYLGLYSTILEELIQLKTEREKSLLISSPVKRYKRLLNQSPELFQKIPHKYIASYLRMSPETLSRIKNLD